MNNYNVVSFKKKSKKYCLLIPLLCEGERYISQVIKMQDKGVFNKVDVIVCDAGSNDGSTDYDFLKNTGHTALLTRVGKGKYSTDIKMGYDFAIKEGYEGFISVDGNDKDDTSGVDIFIKKLEEKYDYVQGSRFIKGGKAINTPIKRFLALRLINEPIMSICAGKHLTDTTNGFRAYSKKFLLDERVQPFRDIFYGYELIYYLPIKASRLKYKVCEIPVIREYPKGQIPTKIGGIKGEIKLLTILWHCILNHYDINNKYKFVKCK